MSALLCVLVGADTFWCHLVSGGCCKSLRGYVQTLLSRPVYHDKLDMVAIASAVARALGDDKTIKPVAHTLLCRLCKIAPTAVLSQLESMILPLQKTLNEKPKDDAIPQEVCSVHYLCEAWL